MGSNTVDNWGFMLTYQADRRLFEGLYLAKWRCAQETRHEPLPSDSFLKRYIIRNLGEPSCYKTCIRRTREVMTIKAVQSRREAVRVGPVLCSV